MPGFVVVLLGFARRISPWEATRWRMSVTLALGLACTLWLYHESGGTAASYPPMPSSLTGSLLVWSSLGLVVGLLSPSNRLAFERLLARSGMVRSCSVGCANV